MQFTNEVKWKAFDFTIAAALLLLLAIIWVELAVGIF
jgi:hypothetical protein